MQKDGGFTVKADDGGPCGSALSYCITVSLKASMLWIKGGNSL